MFDVELEHRKLILTCANRSVWHARETTPTLRIVSMSARHSGNYPKPNHGPLDQMPQQEVEDLMCTCLIVV